MKKNLLLVLLLGVLVLGLTGCSGIKESDLVGTKWVDLSFDKKNGWSSSDEYHNVIRFKEANIMTTCDISGEYCTTYTWKIRGDYIEYYYNGSNPVDKFKISNNNTSLIRISDSRTYTKQD